MSRAHLNPAFVGRVLFKFKIELKMANDFEEFMDAYGVTGDESEFEKARCRVNYKEAERCYLSIAEGLKNDWINKATKDWPGEKGQHQHA